MLGAEIVDDKKIAGTESFKSIALVIAAAEMLLFNASEEIHRRTVYNAEAVFGNVFAIDMDRWVFPTPVFPIMRILFELREKVSAYLRQKSRFFYIRL